MMKEQMMNHKETENREIPMEDVLYGAKKAYREIPVPEAAKTRLLQGIADAKKDLEEEGPKDSRQEIRKQDSNRSQSGNGNRSSSGNQRSSGNRNRGILYLRRGLATAAACLCIITALANVNPVISNAMGRLPIIGAISRVVTFRTFENSSGDFEAKVEVPKIQGETGEDISANQEIEAYAEGLIRQYEEDLAAASGEGNYSMNSSYDVVYDGERYLCIRLRTTLVMAGATENVKVFTVDKESGRTVGLGELCDEALLQKISENIKEQMEAQMAADDKVSYFLHSDVEEWNFKELTGDESFYFAQDGSLVICFDEYEVAPGYMGAVEFTIPREITGDLSH